jgi:hypothetical protein
LNRERMRAEREAADNAREERVRVARAAAYARTTPMPSASSASVPSSSVPTDPPIYDVVSSDSDRE